MSDLLIDTDKIKNLLMDYLSCYSIYKLEILEDDTALHVSFRFRDNPNAYAYKFLLSKKELMQSSVLDIDDLIKLTAEDFKTKVKDLA